MSSRLAKSAGLIGLATLTSRLLGLVRDTVLAAYFGASASMQMDAFNVAFRIPNLLRDLFAEGAMTAAFVPTFTRTLEARGREAAWRIGNLVMNALLVVTGVLVVLGIIFSREITLVLASETFTDRPGALDLTSQLTRIMLPFLTTLAVAAAMMGMLNSLRRFFVPSLSPSMFNVASILSAVLLAPLMPRFGFEPIAAIAVGTLLGGLGQILIQWPSLRREGFRYQPIVSFRDPAMLEILRLMAPATLGLAAVQINVFVNTHLATGQEQGAVSWLQFAFRLMYLPIGIFGVSIATASLPDIARHAAADDMRSIRMAVSRGLRMMLMLNVPATIGLMVLAEPIVALIFEREAFNAYDTTATAAALLFYAPGLLGYSAVKIASPTFYSLRDSRTPVVVSVLSIGANLAINLVLVRVMGYRGLALGTAIAAIFNAVVLLWLLRGRVGGLEGRRVAVAMAKITLAAMAMGAAAHFTAAGLTEITPRGGEAAKFVRVFGGIGAGLAALAAAARLLRIEEFNDAVRRVLERFRR
ncbi:MAG TPA: murein biosynthesis integral membrane protein MurJ [Vicinamibacterales bacterium]|nr:murein biosynthesis integral membrane protein MurJ [Vicinamibacterales bacterium]